MSEIQRPSPACHLYLVEAVDDYEYVKDGDIIIGGVFTVNHFMTGMKQRKDYVNSNMLCLRPFPPYYRYFLTLRFAIDEINKDPTILPNVTLGYQMYDSCNDNRKAVKSVLQILSGPGQTAPNYSCRKRGTLAGFIGDQNSESTARIAQLLALYRYTQLYYWMKNQRSLKGDLMFEENMELVTSFKMFSWRSLNNGSLFVRQVGKIDINGSQQSFLIREEDIVWKSGINKLYYWMKNQRSLKGDLMFEENMELVTSFKMFSWRSLNNGSLFVRQVGKIDINGSQQSFLIREEDIVWKSGINKVPKSQCSENCLPGTRKVPRSIIHSCCYDCVQCSEGEISNVSDSENCQQCRYDEWPNEKKDRCVLKLLDFLSYSDLIGVIFASSSSILCAMTGLILLVVISHQDTAIVKANNRNLSFTLLVSIMLSCLCVFFFLGRPGDITCLLRQISFGILFTIAISCVLGKTIMVCAAFKATKPGSLWKHWIGPKLSTCIVILCSSIQVIISIIWLSISPPFQDLDTNSYQDQIIVRCNEGSVMGFYSVLGYMGFLAAVSFVLAFIVRTLPDSFNEAKYITFSMLVFCSVWIAMIPAYLSTRGKYMVAVEIFAILSSSAGVLGCIFLPKCYIILWRPELNSKTYLMERRSQ
ncbi:PREDICTED: vomeronasal type-2 receptor 26-like [Nanorana parkeri]|uniref:vomeronasal type-2 receptor 26-like n=1 Tax=Nanorana parkeri TaxID=125878 RepID=UPI000854D01F|nr:PREDICTED: vomeronasal type-2 receptor 26-like [Nanorana parkeri]